MKLGTLTVRIPKNNKRFFSRMPSRISVWKTKQKKNTSIRYYDIPNIGSCRHSRLVCGTHRRYGQSNSKSLNNFRARGGNIVRLLLLSNTWEFGFLLARPRDCVHDLAHRLRVRTIRLRRVLFFFFFIPT